MEWCNMDPATLAALIGLITQETPTIIAGVKSLFANQNPTAPVPTDAQVIAAFAAAYTASLAIDQNWLASHPVTAADPVGGGN
jgi:hypothetical protein